MRPTGKNSTQGRKLRSRGKTVVKRKFIPRVVRVFVCDYLQYCSSTCRVLIIMKSHLFCCCCCLFSTRNRTRFLSGTKKQLCILAYFFAAVAANIHFSGRYSGRIQRERALVLYRQSATRALEMQIKVFPQFYVRTIHMPWRRGVILRYTVGALDLGEDTQPGADCDLSFLMCVGQSIKLWVSLISENVWFYTC